MANQAFTHRNAIGLKALAALLAIMAMAGPAEAQRRNTYRSRYNTPYMRAFAGRQYVSPYPAYITPVPANPRSAINNAPRLPPVSGPITPYSPVEYGKIVQMAVDAARLNSPIPTGQLQTVRLLDLATTKSATGQTVYAPVATSVTQVLDRGIILLPTGEEMRLRGVFMPSSTDTNDLRRTYAKEGVQVLGNLTRGATINILLDDPVRDPSGHLLGTVWLDNGTELNSLMLSRGYGSIKPEDFGNGVEFIDLEKAQASAKDARLGIWSR